MASEERPGPSEPTLELRPPLELEIDLDAITHNLSLIQAKAGPGQHCIASIKANAYGFGCERVAMHLQSLGVHSLATGSAAEARAIRAAGVTLPIVLFATTPPAALPGLVAGGFIPTISTFAGAQHLSERLVEENRKPAVIYIKVDMGWGRLGIPIAEAIETITAIAALPNLVIEGLYTHTPFGTAAGRDWAKDRLKDFDALLAEFEQRGLRFAITQARASACVLAGLTDTANAICVGHALYGLNPFGPELAPTVELRSAVASLKTKLIQVVHHGQGADLAVAKQFSIDHAKTIGVLPVGLGDGLVRPTADASAFVLVGDRKARVLAVSLEHTTIELPDDTVAVAGDEVILIGQQGGNYLDLSDFAGWSGQSPLETMMHLSGRANGRPA